MGYGFMFCSRKTCAAGTSRTISRVLTCILHSEANFVATSRRTFLWGFKTMAAQITCSPNLNPLLNSKNYENKTIINADKIDSDYEIRFKKPKTYLTSAPDKPIHFCDLEKFDSKLFTEWIENIDVVMFDCDGVLWMGNRIFHNADQLVLKLRELKKSVYFITNNSTKTREGFLTKLNDLGFEATIDEIVSTSYLAGLYLKEQNFKGKAYVIGSTGITDELNAIGIQTCPIGIDALKEKEDIVTLHENVPGELDPEVGAVVVGYDEHFSYKKMLKAATYLNNPDCLFIGTNTDERFPSSSNNIIIPGTLLKMGTGAIVNAVKTAAEREPIIMGKPSEWSYKLLEERRPGGLDRRRTLMIGDRANTDILFGNTCHMWTLLVLSGVTTFEELTSWLGNEEKQNLIPNFYCPDVDHLFQLLSKHGSN